MSGMTWQEAERHAGRLLTNAGIYGEVYEAAEKVMPHYVFTNGNAKDRTGYCTACNTWVECGTGIMSDQTPEWVNNDPYLSDDDEEQPFIPFAGLPKWDFDRWYSSGKTTQNATGYCPRCGERVRFRSLWRGNQGLCDKRFLIRYAKSAIDPQKAVVCVGYRLESNYRNMDINQPEMPLNIAPLEVCVFRYGEGGDRFIHETKWCGVGGWEMQWSHRGECKSGWAPGMYSNQMQTVLDARSFWQAVEDTPFEMSVKPGGSIWHTNAGDMYDRITVMDALAKYPCIEYLYKLDQDEIADAIINRQIGRRINRKGTTARQVLRLNADDWGEVKGKELRLTPDALDIHRLARRRKWKMNMELITWCGWHRNSYETVIKIHGAMPGADMPKMLKYCSKAGVSLRDYADHVTIMHSLGMGPQDREFLFPRNFADCHHQLACRLDDSRNAEKTIKMQLRIESGILDGYFFSAAGFTLRPAFTAGEIVAEGNYLKHCVGGYVERYADGGTIICFLRDDNDLRRPRYTVEFSVNGNMVQCRGYENDRGKDAQDQKERDRERLELFWKLHKMYRNDLARKKKRERRAKAA